MFKILFLLFNLLIINCVCLPQFYNSDFYPYYYRPKYAIHNAIHSHHPELVIDRDIDPYLLPNLLQDESTAAERLSGHNLHDLLDQRGDDLIEVRQDFMGLRYRFKEPSYRLNRRIRYN